MKYIILEIQKSFDGTVALTPAIVKDNLLDAESTFHSILAAAALSSLAFHSAVILNDEGFRSINSSALTLLYGPTLTSIHDYWKKP